MQSWRRLGALSSVLAALADLTHETEMLMIIKIKKDFKYVFKDKNNDKDKDAEAVHPSFETRVVSVPPDHRNPQVAGQLIIIVM